LVAATVVVFAATVVVATAAVVVVLDAAVVLVVLESAVTEAVARAVRSTKVLTFISRFGENEMALAEMWL
jgi:hypothetical protein